MVVGPVWRGGEAGGVAPGGEGGWAAPVSTASRALIRAEAAASFERASTNPATPSVYNNLAMGMAGGNEAIDRTSEVCNRAAAANRHEDARGVSWFKNAAAVVTDAVLSGAVPEVLPGPVYALPEGATLRGFRGLQGGLPQLSQAYQSGQSSRGG